MRLNVTLDPQQVINKQFHLCLLIFTFNDLKPFQTHSRHSINLLNEWITTTAVPILLKTEKDHGICPLDSNWYTQRLLKCIRVLNTWMKYKSKCFGEDILNTVGLLRKCFLQFYRLTKIHYVTINGVKNTFRFRVFTVYYCIWSSTPWVKEFSYDYCHFYLKDEKTEIR